MRLPDMEGADLADEHRRAAEARCLSPSLGTVADDDITIGERVRIRIGHRGGAQVRYPRQKTVQGKAENICSY
jgi:hypothetical protein